MATRIWQFLSVFILALLSGPFALANNTHDANGWVIYPEISAPTSSDAAAIKHGEYLVKAGDCVACHTAPDGEFMAGGVPLTTPFGTYYSPNITPDKTHGIGDWTTEEFIRSFKSARSANGSFLFPVFPFLWYHKVSEADLRDMKAYLDIIPAQSTPNKPIDAALPFRIRLGMLGWNILFFYPYRSDFKPDTTQTEEWNRGAYLVEGLGHCGMCHTPINFLGAPKRGQAYYGGMVDGYTVPPINEVSLKNFSIDDIVNVFRKDELPGGGKIKAKPMLEVNHDSLSHLTEADLRAIATYIKTMKGPDIGTADTSAKGGSTYQDYCAGCHTTGAGGAPKTGSASAWNERLAQGKQMLYTRAIQGWNGMPAKGNCATCSDQQIEDAVDYILGQLVLKNDAPQKPKGPKPIQPTLSYGKTVYLNNCATCHAESGFGAPVVGNEKDWAPRISKGMDALFIYAITHYKDSKSIGFCATCSDTDVIAAVKYMVQQSQSSGDVTLW
jgi:cytochrome c5